MACGNGYEEKYAISFAIVYFWMTGACLLARHLVQNRLLVVLLYIAFILLPDQWVIVMMQAESLLDAFLEPVTAGSNMAMLLLGHVLRGDNLVAAVAGVLFAGYDFAHNQGRAPSDKEAKCFATSALLVVVLLFGLIGMYLVSIFAAHAIINFLLNARAMLLTLTVVAVLLVTYYFVIKWAFVRCVNHVLAASKRRSQRAGK